MLHPAIQIEAETEYAIIRVLLEMDQLNFQNFTRSYEPYFFLLTQESLCRLCYNGKQKNISKLKSSEVMSIFQCNTIFPALLLKNQLYEQLPIFQQNEVQFEEKVTRKTFPWSIKATCWKYNFDHQVALDADDDYSYCFL